MTEGIRSFEDAIAEFKKQWSFQRVEDAIDSTADRPKWDHTLVQAFFANLGRSLSFEVACEKFSPENWDVAWIKDGTHVRIEIEHGPKAKIQEVFGRLSRTADRYCDKFKEPEVKPDFLGIFVIECNLVEQTTVYKDYFFENVLDPKDASVNYPNKTALDLLIFDVVLKKYRWARAGPGRKYQIFFTRDF
jgi:hypothetical protein